MTESSSVVSAVHETRLAALERDLAEIKASVGEQGKHRTRVETILGVVGASAVIIGVGAMNVRDSVTRLEAGVSSREGGGGSAGMDRLRQAQLQGELTAPAAAIGAVPVRSGPATSSCWMQDGRPGGNVPRATRRSTRR